MMAGPVMCWKSVLTSAIAKDLFPSISKSSLSRIFVGSKIKKITV